MYSKDEIQKINEKLKSAKCPVCGKNVFQIYDTCSQIISYQENEKGYLDFNNLPSLMNCVRVICINCGYVMQFKESMFKAWLGYIVTNTQS